MSMGIPGTGRTLSVRGNHALVGDSSMHDGSVLQAGNPAYQTGPQATEAHELRLSLQKSLCTEAARRHQGSAGIPRKQ